MTTTTDDSGPLASFRNAPVNLGVEIFPTTPDISNTTGKPAPCGFFPDVWGNNAYFNQLCLPAGALNAKELATVIAQSDISVAGPVPQNVYTPTTGWLAGANEDSDPAVYTWVNGGLQINFSGTYMTMLVFNWNQPVVTAETWRAFELTLNGTSLVSEVRSVNNNFQGTVCWNYGFLAGQVVGVSINHDGTAAVPIGPQLGFRVVLLGSGG